MKTSIPTQRKNKLILINSNSLDVYKNFEKERELLKMCDDDTFVLRFWRNSPCVVIGKFQKEEYEVNIDYIKSKNIPIIRRFTGGGTVYHDEGTLNITFCKSKNFYLFSKYFYEEGRGITEIILESIKSFGINARIGVRNSIFVEEKKILGSAMAIKGNIFLYHASIPVNTDIRVLKNVIKWKEEYPKNIRNVVKSVRSKVINLTDLKSLTMDELKRRILENFIRYLKISYVNEID